MSDTLLCQHEDEADISTLGDLGRGVQTLVCLACSRTREAPYDWQAHFGYPPVAAPEGRRGD